MSEKSDPIWARFGAEVRRLREQAGKTQQQLGDGAILAKATISAIERGTRAPKPYQAEALDTALSTDGLLARLRKDLSKQHRVPEWFLDVLQLECKARQILEYEPHIIPGLLQTPAYAEALMGAPHAARSVAEVQEGVRIRTTRLEAVLQDDPPLLRFIVGESALRDQVGSAMIMRKQLQTIARLVDEGTIQLQVLPTGSVSPGLRLPFRLLALSETQTVAYVEHASGGEIVDNARKVERLATLFGALQAEALSYSASLDLIHQIEGELYGHDVA